MSTTVPEPNTAPVTLPVRCRVDQSLWGAVVMLLVMFGLLLATTFSGPRMRSGAGLSDLWLPLAMMTLMIVGPALLFGVFLARAAIIADEVGLRWRRMGDWQTAAWHEVSDYYDKPISGRGSGYLYIVECGEKRLRISARQWKSADVARLKSAIAAYATSARTTGWAVLGSRLASDLPQTFRYNAGDNLVLPRVVGPLLILLLALIGFMISHGATPARRLEMTEGWALHLLPLFLFGGVAFLKWSSVRRRYGETISVSQDGISFTGPEKRVDAA